MCHSSFYWYICSKLIAKNLVCSQDHIYSVWALWCCFPWFSTKSCILIHIQYNMQILALDLIWSDYLCCLTLHDAIKCKHVCNSKNLTNPSNYVEVTSKFICLFLFPENNNICVKWKPQQKQDIDFDRMSKSEFDELHDNFVIYSSVYF